MGRRPRAPRGDRHLRRGPRDEQRVGRRGRRNIYRGLVFWSPNVNIVRDPRGRRGQETYGEDPFLTGAMGTAFVRGMQGDDPRYLKMIATAKHYAVHSGPEPLRHTFDARPSETDFPETYIPAFSDLVVNGKAESVMCSYNSARGQPACGNDEPLRKVLRKEWGFPGYVVSDCGAVIDISEGHKARKTTAEGSAMALLAGTDLECGSGSWEADSPDAFEALREAVQQGLVKESDVDNALRRLFRAQVKLGVYDPPERVPWSGYRYETVVNSEKHRQLALEAARESIVLLKNENATLPLKKGLGSIAVIGPNADDVEVLLGNYNGTPVAPVTILAGLPDLWVVPDEALSTGRDAERKPSLAGAYYRGHFEGAPVFTRADAAVDFDWTDKAPDASLDDDSFSVRWTGELTAPATGRYTWPCAARRSAASSWTTSRSRRAARTTRRRSPPEA